MFTYIFLKKYFAGGLTPLIIYHNVDWKFTSESGEGQERGEAAAQSDLSGLHT